MTDSEKVKLIGKMIEDYWGVTEGGDVKSLTALVEMIETVVDFA